MSEKGGPENILKTLGIIVLAIVVVVFLSNLLFSGQTGLGSQSYSGQGLGYQSHYGQGMGHEPYYGQAAGYNLNGSLGSVLSLAVQLLWLILVISLVIGIVVIIKKHIFEEKKINLDFIQELFKNGYTCIHCGTRMKTEFKFCPGCGADTKKDADNTLKGKVERGTKSSQKLKEGEKKNE